jgi:hypothetical protein
MNNKERGWADWATVIIGLFLCFLLIGFFKPDNGISEKISFKSLMRLPCGLTFSGISNNDKIVFPIEITGYINGCGWNRNKMSAGTIQVFDGKGMPVTSPFDMTINEMGTELPLSFKATLRPNFAPQTDNGQLVIKSNAGILKIVPISF